MKLFIHIPKNGGMTIRESEVFKKRILAVNRNMISDYKRFQTL